MLLSFTALQLLAQALGKLRSRGRVAPPFAQGKVSSARAESQEIFVDALMDANTRAVGALIDANMEEESTKLRALQTQQQLSVESLAIANAAAQNVLALFR